MKGNNRGFTLIEILAAVVILGILVGVSLPAIVGLFDDSKGKLYVSDARKLISLAEYKVKASSSVIEKPDEGDCILISMRYLDSTDFDTAPSGGEYLRDSSYVVVKNENGSLEYSATVVEKLTKGGYKGVELSKKSTLIGNKALKRVIGFKPDDVLKVDTDITIGYINEKLGSTYMDKNSKISAIYHYNELVDDSSNYVPTNVPKITMASILSTESDKYYNSLKAELRLKVDDNDTPRENLKVYVSYNDYDDTITPENYGNEDLFTHSFDFESELGAKYNGAGIKIYVIVKDPDGNETRKVLTYKLHMNEAPIIDKTSAVTRREKDVYYGVPKNMLTAKVSLIVSDDIDSNSKLTVCFKESAKDEVFNSCDDYHGIYSDGYFSAQTNTMEYLFHNCDGGKCKRDGSTHYLTIFVKDTYGSISKKRFKYTFSINEIPQITELSIESDGQACREGKSCPPNEVGGSKKILVNVTLKDDVDEPKQMRVRVSDGTSAPLYEYKEKPIEYTIYTNYDGSTKTIKVNAKDSEDAEGEIVTREYKLYTNKPPSIESFRIESDGTACHNSEMCPVEDGGSKRVKVYLEVDDDINYGDLEVCFGTQPNRCTYTAYFVKYMNQASTYTMDVEHDGSIQNVYVYVTDDGGYRVGDKSADYKLYSNKPPVLDFAFFNSSTDGKPISGSLNTLFTISASDDVDSSEYDSNAIAYLKFQITEDGVVTHKDQRVVDYINKETPIRLAGTHDGKTRHIEVKVYDSDGASDAKTMTYDVYEGRPPTIDVYNLYSNEIPCLNDLYCPAEEYGHYNAKYMVKASDDIDENGSIQICATENGTECDTGYLPYTNYLDDDGNPKEMSYRFNADSEMPYDGSTKTLYLYVKDSDQNVVKEAKTYKLYANQKPVITKDPVITKNDSSSDKNLPDITYAIRAEDDLDSILQIKYCYKKNDGPEECTSYEDMDTTTGFNKTKKLNKDNIFASVVRPNGETFVIYAKIKDSYGQEVTSASKTYKLYTDMDPSIYQTNIVSGRRIYKNANGDVLDSLENIENPEEYSEYTRLKIRFSVDDPYDKYSVCVSSNSSICENYVGSYDGNNCSTPECSKIRKSNDIEHDVSGFIEDGEHFELYLFAKDSYNAVNSVTLYNETYTECLYHNEEDATYEYEFDSEETHSTYDHNNPITMVRCAGKCYYYNAADSTTNEIFAIYKTRITYTDKFNSSVTCNADNPEVVESDVTCSFKDCFYKNDSYVRRAIGTRLIYDDEPWTEVVNNNIYTCTGHYTLYLSSYNTGDKDITLNPTNTRICNTAINEYAFDSTAEDPYVRVSD